jgi:hypothetical protein
VVGQSILTVFVIERALARLVAKCRLHHEGWCAVDVDVGDEFAVVYGTNHGRFLRAGHGLGRLKFHNFFFGYIAGSLR